MSEVGYGQVTLTSHPHRTQLESTHNLLMSLSNDSLLEARRSSGSEWVIATNQEPLRLVPFTEVGEAAYTTYLKLS